MKNEQLEEITDLLKIISFEICLFLGGIIGLIIAK